MSFVKIVLCSLCCNFVWGSNIYRAAVVDISETDISSRNYPAFILDAGKTNVDLLVLPNPKIGASAAAFDSCVNGLDNYDEIVKSVSSAAKEARIYVVAHLYEKSRCESREELIRSNLVFDRDGAVISVYRKPVNGALKCNTTISKTGRFTTDFGVTFGVLFEDDIILTNTEELSGIKNFVVSSSPEGTFLFAKQFATFWAYTNNVNIISDDGKFNGNVDFTKTSNNLLVADFETYGASDTTKSLLITPPHSYSTGDMNHYIIRPLDMDASFHGYKETVCHGSFCCEFYVKTSFIGSNKDVTYGLVVYDGVQHLENHNIGVQTCSVMACAGLYKRSCLLGSENNNTNVKFDKISIGGNFTNDNSAQFPIILTTTQTVFNNENFKFTRQNKKSNYITTELYSTENVLTFGVFGRDYSKDYETSQFGGINNTDYVIDFSEYISSENVQEFFDYLWIRVRILIFVVSIYILEMM